MPVNRMGSDPEARMRFSSLSIPVLPWIFCGHGFLEGGEWPGGIYISWNCSDSDLRSGFSLEVVRDGH